MIDYISLVKTTKPTIVQIGSHDGILGEEYGLHEFLETLSDFKLFLVEPLPDYFNNLKNVYGKYTDKVTYTNCAITDIDGDITMLERGCMSIIHAGGNKTVKSLTWSTFLEQNNIKEIDLLLLDCEGYEFQILKQNNFENLIPKVIRYEYLHIPNQIECDNFILSKNYKIDLCKYDPTYNKIAYL